MRIAIAADHNGVSLKAHLRSWMTEQGHEVDDRGTHDEAGTVDYPRLCEDVCRRVVDEHAERALMIGGTGSGEQIACNKIAGVRAGIGHCLFTTEIARAHNDANVLVLGAKVVAQSLAERILEAWLTTPFKGGRHQGRVDQIAALERGESLAH